MDDLQEILALSEEPPAGQQRLRAVEHHIRQQAVALLKVYGENGTATDTASRWMAITTPTLRDWKQQERDGKLKPMPLGRRPDPLDWTTRAKLTDAMWHAGREVSVAFLMEMCPNLPRAFVEERVRRFKRILCLCKRWRFPVLTWEQPGRVWAMDFYKPPQPVDGRYKQVLVVRDLASGRVLMSFPVTKADGQTVAWALETLFFWYGAPLVLKNDNGSNLIDDLVQKLLDRYGVTCLRSPVYYPQYNGAVESGIGHLQVRAIDHAARYGHPGYFTCDDIYAAQCQANEISRPKGSGGPSPDALWEAKTEITQGERQAFLALLEKCRLRLTQAAKVSKLDEGLDEKQLEREAITRALMEAGYLSLKGRRVSLGFMNQNLRDIS